MSSDSDSDCIYSDYVGKRRKLIAKNRKNNKSPKGKDTLNFLNDYMADVEVPDQREGGMLWEDDDDDEDIDSSIPKKVQSHKEYLEEKKAAAIIEYEKKMEEELQENLDDSVIWVSSDSLDRVVKTCCDLRVSLEDRNAHQSEVIVLDDEDDDDTPSHRYKESLKFPIEVFDMENRGAGKIRVQVVLGDTFEKIRHQMATKWNCTIEEVILKSGTAEIGRSDTVRSMGFTFEQIPPPIIEAYKMSKKSFDVNNQKSTDLDENKIQLKIQIERKKKPLEVIVEKDTTTSKLRDIIYDVIRNDGSINIVKNKMSMVFDDELLSADNATCDELGIESGDCIDVF